MKKGNRSCLITLGAFLVFILCFAWYFGFIPVGESGPKAGLRHALDLKVLPSSVEIVGHGGESWTDYLFVADLRISPDQFPELLTGRDFEPYQHYLETIEESWISNFEPLPVAESWEWPANDDDDSFVARCSIHTNADRTRVFVRYVSD